MVLTKSPIARIDTLLGLVERPRTLAASNFQNYQADLLRIFNTVVLDMISVKFATDRSHWAVHVRKLVNKWRGMFPATTTLKAFARRSGMHRPKSCEDPLDMSQQILILPREDMLEMIDTYQLNIHSVKLQIQSDVLHAITGLREGLQRNPDIGGHNMGSFWANFKIHEGNLVAALDKRFKAFGATLRSEVNLLTSSLEATPCITAMQSVYNNVLTLKKVVKTQKAGVVELRYDAFYQDICNNRSKGPFPALQRSLEDRFEVVLQSELRELAKVIAKPFDDFQNDLNLKFGKNNDGEYISQDLRAEIKQAVDAVMPECLEKLDNAKGHLKEVKLWWGKQQKTEMRTESEDVGIKFEDD